MMNLEIRNVADNAIDVVSNARPLRWYNNASRENGRLTCPITAKEE